MKFTKITEMEQLVMKCIWTSDEDMSLPNVMGIANGKYKKDWKPQTVSTYLSHLVKKGYLNFYRQGRTFKYHSLIDEADYRAEVLKNHIEFWDDGDINLFAKDLLSDGTVSSEQLAELKKALN